MEIKLCKKCLRELPISEFYKHHRGGACGSCKECVKESARRNRAEKIEYYRQYDKDRAKNKNRIASTKRYRESDLGKSTAQAGNARYRKNHKDRYDAHKRVTAAILSGKLVRPDFCTICGSRGKIEAHHDDYTKPLSVTWMCERCHKDRHQPVAT